MLERFHHGLDHLANVIGCKVLRHSQSPVKN
jgi:hypothetical protein